MWNNRRGKDSTPAKPNPTFNRSVNKDGSSVDNQAGGEFSLGLKTHKLSQFDKRREREREANITQSVLKLSFAAGPCNGLHQRNISTAEFRRRSCSVYSLFYSHLYIYSQSLLQPSSDVFFSVQYLAVCSILIEFYS